jgi:hypothetical protein
MLTNLSRARARWLLDADDGAGSGSSDKGDGTDDSKGDDGSTDDSKGDDGKGDDGGDSDKGDDDVEKWKALARKHEQRATSNAAAAKELEKLKKSQMSDTEKAVTEAEERGRNTARLEAGEKVAAAEIKAALKGVVPDPAAIVEDLNLKRYLTDDGEVDDDAVEKLRTKYEAAFKSNGKTKDGDKPDLGQGDKGGNRARQLSRDDLKTMKPDDIEKARVAGQLDDVLGIKT